MKTMTLTKERNRFQQGWDFLCYGLDIFACIGFELLLGYGIEFRLYGCDFKGFTKGQLILHWILICSAWAFGAWLIVRDCAKKTDLDLARNFREKTMMQGVKEMGLTRWILLLTGTVLCLISTWIDWSGSKVAKEIASRGILYPMQFLYYLVEMVMVLLIIVFGQYAFEKWFKNDKIPYGGILVALTWGLGHWMSKGSLVDGIYTAIGGFFFGSTYLLTGRNIKLSYLFLCIMFIL